MLPPGDARNCLVAMADPDSPLARVLAYRFPHGEGLAGHALGNLSSRRSPTSKGRSRPRCDTMGELLGARGRVLPSTLDDVVLAAEDVAGTRVVGQANVAESPAPIDCVRFAGAGTAEAYAPAVEALREADLVVVGPGSLFTSLLPNFLVRGIADALRASRGRVVFVCNVANQRGESGGMDAADHVDALLRHQLEGVLRRRSRSRLRRLPDLRGRGAGARRTGCGRSHTRAHGIDVVLADLADPADPRHHSRERLLRALRDVGSP